MISRELEWAFVSDGDEPGPIVVGWWLEGGFLPLFYCPFCNAEI